jgi:UDP-N-acetylmuramate--alanine ligase
VYIDDYAHHPTEINAVHQAVRELYPMKKYSRFSSHTCLAEPKILPMDLQRVCRNSMKSCCSIFIRRENCRWRELQTGWLMQKMTNPHKN